MGWVEGKGFFFSSEFSLNNSKLFKILNVEILNFCNSAPNFQSVMTNLPRQTREHWFSYIMFAAWTLQYTLYCTILRVDFTAILYKTEFTS